MKETFEIIRQDITNPEELKNHINKCSSKSFGQIPEKNLEGHATLYFYFRNNYKGSVNFGDPMDRELNFALNHRCKHVSDYTTHESWYTMPYGEINSWFPEEMSDLLNFHQSTWNSKFLKRTTVNLQISRETLLRILELIGNEYFYYNIYEFPNPEFLDNVSEEIRKSMFDIYKKSGRNKSFLPMCSMIGVLITSFDENWKSLYDNCNIDIIKKICESL